MEKYATTFSLEFIIKKIALRECLLCETNLDENIGKEKWHIPLCKKHRNEYLEKEFKELEFRIDLDGKERVGISTTAIQIRKCYKKLKKKNGK